MNLKRYKALTNCIAGGSYRKEGDIFYLPEMEDIPKHLCPVPEKKEDEMEEAPGPVPEKKRTGRPPKEAPGPTLSDIPGALRD